MKLVKKQIKGLRKSLNNRNIYNVTANKSFTDSEISKIISIVDADKDDETYLVNKSISVKIQKGRIFIINSRFR